MRYIFLSVLALFFVNNCAAWPSLFSLKPLKAGITHAQKIAEQVIAKKVLAPNAIPAAKLLAKGALQAATHTLMATGKLAMFSARNPEFPLGVAIAASSGYLYAKRNDIKDWCVQKMQEYKPYAAKAAMGILAFGTAAVLKKFYGGLYDGASKLDLPLAQTINHAQEYSASAQESSSSAQGFNSEPTVELKSNLTPRERDNFESAWPQGRLSAHADTHGVEAQIEKESGPSNGNWSEEYVNRRIQQFNKPYCLPDEPVIGSKEISIVIPTKSNSAEDSTENVASEATINSKKENSASWIKEFDQVNDSDSSSDEGDNALRQAQDGLANNNVTQPVIVQGPEDALLQNVIESRDMSAWQSRFERILGHLNGRPRQVCS